MTPLFEYWLVHSTMFIGPDEKRSVHIYSEPNLLVRAISLLILSLRTLSGVAVEPYVADKAPGERVPATDRRGEGVLAGARAPSGAARRRGVAWKGKVGAR